MRRVKRLNEILEECIEAGLTGRRSLAQSLALYPAQAEELGPLLRTALSISESFQSYTPPAAVQQRVRSRFLADAAARRNLRHLEGSFERRGWLAGLFRKPVLGGFAATAAVAIAVVAITVGGINVGSNEKGISVINPAEPPAEQTVVFNLGSRVDSVTEQIQGGGRVQSADLSEISALFDQLAGASSEELQESTVEFEAILSDTLYILASATGDSAGVIEDQAVIDAIDTATRGIAEAIGFDLPDPIVVGDATPEPTDPPVEPTDAPAEPTPAPTDGGNEPTVAPTPTAPPAQSTPTATADNRAPPGFLP